MIGNLVVGLVIVLLIACSAGYTVHQWRKGGCSCGCNGCGCCAKGRCDGSHCQCCGRSEDRE